MSASPVTVVINRYCDNHADILAYLQKLSDSQIEWRQSAEIHCIAWHIWHLARWADYFQACIPGMTPELGRRLPAGVQIWDTEKLADRWGFDNTKLGFRSTGMQMLDEIALHLPFPAKADLLSYMQKAFAAAEQAVKTIDDEQFLAAEQLQPLTEGFGGSGTIGDWLLIHIWHDSRHLGMMECLLGLQGVPGTANV